MRNRYRSHRDRRSQLEGRVELHDLDVPMVDQLLPRRIAEEKGGHSFACVHRNPRQSERLTPEMNEPRVVPHVGMSEQHAVEHSSGADSRSDAIEHRELSADVGSGVDQETLIGDRVDDGQTGRRQTRLIDATGTSTAGLGTPSILSNSEHRDEGLRRIHPRRA